MAEGTIPPDATAAVDELRASAGELGTELAWYADMTKKAFRGVSLTAVLGVYSGGLAVQTDQGTVVAPWEQLKFLSRKHDMSIGGLNKNREDELVFSVAGHGEIAISHNRSKDNPGGPLEPVAALAEATYGTWVTDQAKVALRAGQPFAFGDVVVEPDKVRFDGKTVPIDDTLEVTVPDRNGSVRIKSGDADGKQVSQDFRRERISSPFALRVAVTVLRKHSPASGRKPSRAPTGPPPAEVVREAAEAAAERAGLGQAASWYGVRSSLRRLPIALGVFERGFVLVKEGTEPTVLPWSECAGVGPVGVMHGFTSVKAVDRNGRVVEISSQGGAFPTTPEVVRTIAAELTRGYTAHCVRTLRESIAQHGSATFGKITIDPRGVSRTVLRKELRLDFADVASVIDHFQLLPKQVPQAILVATEVSAAVAGIAVRQSMDVPSLPAFTTLVHELMDR